MQQSLLVLFEVIALPFHLMSSPSSSFLSSLSLLPLLTSLLPPSHLLGLQVPLLAEKLQLLCKGRLRVKGVTSLTPGQPCLARFRGDGEGRWYRVKVEKCNEDNTAVVSGSEGGREGVEWSGENMNYSLVLCFQVFYVDFGNKDILRCSQLIDVAPLMEVPIQASAMRLANTVGSAITVEGGWSVCMEC